MLELWERPKSNFGDEDHGKSSKTHLASSGIRNYLIEEHESVGRQHFSLENMCVILQLAVPVKVDRLSLENTSHHQWAQNSCRSIG